MCPLTQAVTMRRMCHMDSMANLEDIIVLKVFTIINNYKRYGNQKSILFRLFNNFINTLNFFFINILFK